MLWKFYSAKTAGMKANFMDLKRNLFSYYLSWIVFISKVPLPHVNLYLSCLYRRVFKIAYIWDVSLACNYITNGKEDTFWALVIKFRLFHQWSSKNTAISTTSSALYQRNAGFLLVSLCPTKELLYLESQLAQWWQLVTNLIHQKYFTIIKTLVALVVFGLEVSMHSSLADAWQRAFCVLCWENIM